MKKHIIKLLAISLIFMSCDNYDFGDINVNPNSPSSANPQALMTNAITSSRAYFQTNTSLYVQWLSQTQYTEASLYQQNPADFGGIYTNCLSELQAAINLNTGDHKDDVIGFGSNKNQIAVLEIYKAFIYAKITDVWGDVPYSEALSVNITPVYDNQENIYKSLIEKLSKAENDLDDNEKPMNDILYHGDLGKWRKFANSLRMVYALRLSKKFPSNTGYAATEFKSAFNDSDGYMETNNENLEYITNDDYKNNWYSTFDGRSDYAPSDTFINKLLELSDKRIEVYATEKDGAGSGYAGVPYGWDRPSTLEWADNNKYSLMNESLRQVDTPIKMFTSSQVLFAIAEAIHRGWVDGDAESFYNEGIKQSYLDHGLTESDYEAYIAEVPYNEDTAIKDIATQRWIALYPGGSLEAWSSWRRTGYPELTPARDAVNDGSIPLRYLYPSGEANVNSENLEAAISRLPGGDIGTTPFWWIQ